MYSDASAMTPATTVAAGGQRSAGSQISRANPASTNISRSVLSK
jgi:hypothetical protein